MYREKLVKLLEALECQNIEDLVERDEEVIENVGKEIALNAKNNAYKGLIGVYRRYLNILDQIKDDSLDSEEKYQKVLEIIKKNQENKIY